MNSLAAWMAVGIAIGAGAAEVAGDPAWIGAGLALGAAAGLGARQLKRRRESPPET